MKPFHLSNLVALLIVLCLAVVSVAGVPQTINYQGYLKNTDGTPVSTPTSIRFSLYSSNPARNNPVWRETQSVTPANGIYSTQLGSVTPITAPFDVPYWLGVKVASEAEMTLQQLSSAPYARRAGVADSVSSGTQLVTTVPTGTAPIQVVSTTLVPNLNADMVDGKHADEIVLEATSSMQPTITDMQTQVSGIASILPMSANWGIGKMLQGGFVDTPQIAINNTGYALAAWVRNAEGTYNFPYNVEARYYAPEVGWEPVYHEVDPTSLGFHQPTIDSNGNAMIVYMSGGVSVEKLMYTRRSQSTAWTTPQQINSVATTQLREVKTTIDPTGNVIAVWQQYAAPGIHIWTNRYVNGIGWGTSQQIDNAGSNDAQYPHVAVDGSGNAIAVWQQYDGSHYSIWSRRFVTVTGWSAAVALSENNNSAGGAKVVMDAAGNAMAFWVQTDGIWYRRYDKTSGWEAAQQFTAGSNVPQVAMSSTGSSIAIWPNYGGSSWQIMTRRDVPGGGWGTPEALAITLDNSHNFTSDDVRIAMNSSGGAVAVGIRYNSVSGDVWSMQYTPGAGWGPIKMIEADMSYGSSSPRVEMDDSGNAVAAWMQRVVIGGGSISQIMTSHLVKTQSLVLPDNSGSYSTTLLAPSGSENRTIQLPDVSGKIITTGNLTDITTVGTISQGEWQGWRIGIPYGGTDATTAAGARTSLQVPGLQTANGFTGTQSISSGSTTAPGLVLLPVANQTANLQEWQDRWGTKLASVSASGVFAGNGSGLTNITATYITGTLAIGQGGTGANSAASARNSLAVPGLATANSFTGLQTISTGSASTKGLIVRGTASQTANLQEWQDSNGITRTSVSASGKVGIGKAPGSDMLDVNGTLRMNDNIIYLRGNSGDIAHGVAYYSPDNFAQGNPDGPVLFGCGGGTLGTACGGNRAVLKWDNAGNVSIPGTLSKGSGSFKIDHPLDPQNKYLYHSFVESPDMMNIYNGNVVTDEKGLATVEMPAWFGALNREFRYQLTVIGQFAQAIIAREIEGGRFTIQSDKPAVKVSWQVTGIRKDAYAEKNRILVEEDKPTTEKGTCLHPEACR